MLFFVSIFIIMLFRVHKNENKVNHAAHKPTPYTLVKIDSNNNIQNKEPIVLDGFVIEYMRLYNPFGVECLINIMENGKIPTRGEYGPYITTHEFTDFWMNKWRYRGARIIKSKLWQEFKNDGYVAAWNLYFTAMPNVLEHYDNLCSYDMGGPGCQDCPDELISDSLYEKNFEVNTQNFNADDVGFLFMIIKNESKTKFNEISIEYAEYKNPLQIFSTPDASFADYEDFLIKRNPEKIALTRKRFKDEKIKQIKISNVRQDDAFIWLIAIYKANRLDGLPAFYISNVLVPKKIFAVINQDTCIQLIREPFGESAARIFVPLGWEGQ